jgi:CHAT domain-containing protein/Tfp pilus assembly protein PilF
MSEATVASASYRIVAAAFVILAWPARGFAAAAPDDPRAVIALAQALHAKAEYRRVLALLTPLESAKGLTPEERVGLFSRIALAHANLSEHEPALAAAARAEAAARPLDEPKTLARVAHLKGELARLRGNEYHAIGHYEAGLALAGRTHDPALVGRSYNGLAATYQALGDWARVLDYTRRAVDADANPSDIARSSRLLALGVAYYEFRERDAAERHFRELLAHAERTGRRREVSLALGELGLLYWEFDRDRQRALEHDEKGLAVARELGALDLVATWLLNSGNVYRDEGELQEALRRYREALALEANAGNRGPYAVLLKNIGQVLAAQGRDRDAERWLLRARNEADRLGRPHTRWEARMELGRLYAAAQPARADAAFRESLDLIEQQHGSILLENFRIGALSRSLEKYDPYDLYIEFLLAQGRSEDAFAIAERARARAFLETLAGAREEIASVVPADYREREDALLARISRQQARLRTAALDAAAREDLLADVGRAEADLGALRLRLAVDRPAVAQARYPTLSGVPEVQQRVLRPGEALLMFFLGRRSSAAWLVTPDRLEVRTLPPRSVLEPAARDYLQVLHRPSADDAHERATALSRLLDVDAMTRLLPDEARLIVVPHGILHYVPAETLVSRDRYLVERFVVSYAPSASSLAYLRKKDGRAAAGELVAVGDPLSAPAAPSAERGVALAALSRLKPLPHSGRELRRVTSLLAGPAILDGARATEERLQRMDLSGAAILHFATHGVIDEVHPERSGLALTAAPPGGDGLLQMREIYRLKLRAALVTLSACETALGKDVTGEGVVGLVRAFFYAGADAVLASLWSVSDSSTAEWMGRFYEGVRGGVPMDRAAREAKLAFLRGDGRLRHPYYWAPFVLTGHATAVAPVRPAQRWTPLVIALVAAAALATLGAASVLRRLHRRGDHRAVAGAG